MGLGTRSPVGRIQSQEEALCRVPEMRAGLCHCLLVKQSGIEEVVMSVRMPAEQHVVFHCEQLKAEASCSVSSRSFP